MGDVGILNVGAGDTKIVFDPANPDDMARSAAIVQDMLKRGYVLMVDVGNVDDQGRPVLARALRFDPERCEYIVAGFTPVEEIRHVQDSNSRPETELQESPSITRKARRQGTRRVAASKAKGIAVPRTAGG